MYFIALLALLWLVLYAALYAMVGDRLGRWLARRSPHRAGPWASTTLATVALAGCLALMAISMPSGDPISPSPGAMAGISPSGPITETDALASQAWPFTMGVLTSCIGNLLTSWRRP